MCEVTGGAIDSTEATAFLAGNNWDAEAAVEEVRVRCAAEAFVPA